MKTQICFAGFAGEELAALQQASSSITGAWECRFVADGAAALEAMKTAPCDAVVANMQMEGMSGAVLLQKIAENHPRTLRFVISDVADQELIINCIGGTHQFIARPWKPQDLITVVRRSFALDAWLSSDQLRKLAPRLRRLPSLPSTYFEVLKQVESANASVESVGQVIARDPAVTARLLQIVNSAAFALAQKVTDPQHAVCLLGLETVKSVVLCLQVFAQSDEAKQSGISMERIWNHSFTVAKAARAIAQQHSNDSNLANDAFTAGLLHDVGRIVLASNVPKEYAAVVAAAKSKGRPLHEEEAEQLGVTHAQVGAYLLGLWGMPAALVEAAALHHTPQLSATKEFSLLTAVHVANVEAHAAQPANDGLPLPQYDTAYLDEIGFKYAKAAPEVSAPEPAPIPTQSGETEIITQPQPLSREVEPAEEELAKAARFPWYIPAAAAALLIAVIWFWKHTGGSTMEVRAKTPEPVAEASAATPAEQQEAKPAVAPAAANSQAIVSTKTVTETSQPAAPADPFDSVKVQGVFVFSGRPSVMINGKTLFVGDKINGLEVVSITSSRVELSTNGEKKLFKVK
jgi:HD-like signal output (HDOD) protein